jgi:apoptosis-inducing factor 3
MDERVGACSDPVDGGSANKLVTEGRTLGRFGDIEVLIVRTRRGLFAVENRCPHMGRRLTDAPVSGRTLVCPGHHRRYDLAVGKQVGHASLSPTRFRTFDVDVASGRVWLRPRGQIDAHVC